MFILNGVAKDWENNMKNHLDKIKELFKANGYGLSYISKNHYLLYPIQVLNLLFAGLSASVITWCAKQFVDDITIYRSMTKAMLVIVFMVMFILLKNIFQYTADTYSNYAYSKTRMICKSNFAVILSKIMLPFYDYPENRNCLSRAEQYAAVGTEQLLSYIFSLITNCVSMISILLILTPFEVWVLIFLVVLIVFRIYIDSHIAKLNFDFNKKRVSRERNVAYYTGVFRNPSAVVDVNIFNGLQLFLEKYTNLYGKHIEIQKKHNIKISLIRILSCAAVIVQNLVLYGYAGIELLSGRITIGEYTLFFTAVNYLNSILLNLRNSISNFVPISMEAQNYVEFLRASDGYRYDILFNDKGNTISMSKINSIEFVNVTMAYPGKKAEVLHDINFKINRGEIISIVGLNGSGKSTILKLLLGFYSPISGHIFINGLPIKNIDIKEYWKHCAAMFQNVNVFAFSAIENVSLCDINNSDIDRIRCIFDEQDLNCRLEKEKSGIYTELSREFNPDGTSLSDGESKKIAFSRVKYKDADLIVLDEPASTLDAVAEQDMFNFIKDLHLKYPNKIIIFVSHKLSNSIIADKILYMDGGKATHYGNHEYMIKHCHQYKKLFEIQNHQENKVSDKSEEI